MATSRPIVWLEEVWRKWPSEDVASVPVCFRIFRGESVLIPVAGRTLFQRVFSEFLGPPIPEASSSSLFNITVLVQEQDMA